MTHTTERGFTLVETVIYLALFGMLMGGAVVAAYNLFESGGRAQTHAMLQEEGNFLIAKINWAVSGAQTVNAPGGGQYGSQLSVNKVTSLDAAGQPVVTAVTISLPTAPGNVLIQNGTSGPWALNNTNVQVTRFGLLHVIASGNGIDPERVEASTTLSVRTPSGAVITEDFSTIVYVRR